MRTGGSRITFWKLFLKKKVVFSEKNIFEIPQGRFGTLVTLIGRRGLRCLGLLIKQEGSCYRLLKEKGALTGLIRVRAPMKVSVRRQTKLSLSPEDLQLRSSLTATCVYNHRLYCPSYLRGITNSSSILSYISPNYKLSNSLLEQFNIIPQYFIVFYLNFLYLELVIIAIT